MSHRQSVAWQKAMQLALQVYKLTAVFPRDERFGITNQLRRAAVSVPSNIAEGKGRLHRAELIHFLAIARGSVQEVSTQLELAEALGYGDNAAISAAQETAIEVHKILNATLTTLRSKDR